MKQKIEGGCKCIEDKETGTWAGACPIHGKTVEEEVTDVVKEWEESACRMEVHGFCFKHQSFNCPRFKTYPSDLAQALLAKFTITKKDL
jgi:hypothetical protein